LVAFDSTAGQVNPQNIFEGAYLLLLIQTLQESGLLNFVVNCEVINLQKFEERSF
jgi:hypothetical protein